MSTYNVLNPYPGCSFVSYGKKKPTDIYKKLRQFRLLAIASSISALIAIGSIILQGF